MPLHLLGMLYVPSLPPILWHMWTGSFQMLLPGAYRGACRGVVGWIPGGYRAGAAGIHSFLSGYWWIPGGYRQGAHLGHFCNIGTTFYAKTGFFTSVIETGWPKMQHWNNFFTNGRTEVLEMSYFCGATRTLPVSSLKNVP